MSDGYTSRNEGTSFIVHGMCAVSIIESLWQQCAVDLYAHSYHIRGRADTRQLWKMAFQTEDPVLYCPRRGAKCDIRRRRGLM